MLSPQEFVDCLKENGVELFTGVPDSLLKELCSCMAHTSRPGEHIIAANEGGAHTVVYPFSTGDHFAIEPSAGGGALRLLADSRFHPREWVVRADATHGKSKTYRRTEVFPHDHAGSQDQWSPTVFPIRAWLTIAASGSPFFLVTFRPILFCRR